MKSRNQTEKVEIQLLNTLCTFLNRHPTDRMKKYALGNVSESLASLAFLFRKSCKAFLKGFSMLSVDGAVLCGSS